ncbi:FHA domain-containing protein [Eleftheria terrae]|uniref:FHA domain-containing protein n=1 Tax=Eleftheria terrae TaxID=1597781 RepID=UPI00263B8DB7|nr:FHA domain-containing protein [Eleftheria terrae]WKB54659.1 FHA domain-containing protein [Eleftheria terrae]
MDKLALVEVLDRDGLPRQAFAVTSWPVRLGRALDCDMVLDDPHVAPHHLVLHAGPEGLRLQVGDTVNGVRLGRLWLQAGESALRPAGEDLVLGGTRVRVRLASDPLPPEQVVPHAGRWRPGLTSSALATTGAWGLWQAWEHYLTTDPGNFLAGLVVLLPAFLVLAGWAVVWALASKLFRHRFDFWTHLRIAAAGLLLSSVVGATLGLLGFMTSWTWLSRCSELAQALVLSGAIYRHLCAVLPARRRRLAVGTVLLTAAGLATGAALRQQQSGRLSGELYMTTLPPPALHLAPSVPADTFLQEAAGLKQQLDRAVQDSADDNGEDTDAFPDED